jgi:hypothetical protein
MARKESHTMKHLKITRLMAALGATAAAAAAVSAEVAAAPNRPAGAATNSAAEVRATERALLHAAVAGDIPTSRALLAPDFQQIDVTGSTATRAEYLAAIGGAIDFVTLKPLAPIRVRLYGNAAVARLHLAFEVHVGPTTLKHRGWTTDLFERRHGQWQVVWEQSTATPNDEALLIRALQPKS